MEEVEGSNPSRSTKPLNQPAISCLRTRSRSSAPSPGARTGPCLT